MNAVASKIFATKKNPMGAKIAWALLLAPLLLIGCSAKPKTSLSEVFYTGSARSFHGIEASAVISREPANRQVCEIEARFANPTRTPSRFMTLAVRGFYPDGKLASLDLVRSPSVDPGQRNTELLRDLRLCQLDPRQVASITLELY